MIYAKILNGFIKKIIVNNKVKHLAPLYIEERRREYEASFTDAPRKEKSRREKTICGGTFNEIKRLMTRDFVPAFGELMPNQITENVFADFCDNHTGDMANHRKVLGGFLSFCKRKGYLDNCPSFKIPKWIRRKRKILNPDQIRRLVEEARKDDIDFMFVSLGLMHGLRPNERTTLAKSNFCFKKMSILIFEENVKTRQSRIVAMNQFCAPIYKKYFDSYDSPWVFPHRDDPSKHASKGWYQSRWKKLKRSAGFVQADRVTLIDITPHDLTGTCRKYGALSPKANDLIRKKAFGASPKIQDDLYITEMAADEVRAMTEAMTDKENGVPGLMERLQS